MRIAYITSFFPPDRIAGAELGTQVMAEHMASLGHDVHVLITRPSKCHPNLEKKDGITIHWLHTPSLKGLRFGLEIFSTLATLFKLKPDVIQSNCLLPGAFAAVLAQPWFKTKTMCLCYGYDVCDMTGFIAQCGRWALRHIHQPLAATQYCSSVMKHHVPNISPHVFLAGCDAEAFPHRPKQQNSLPYQLLFVGRMIPEKGLHFLIALMHELGPDYHLKVIGSGDRTKIEAQANQLNVVDRITFLSHVPNRELHHAFEASDCFVLPSYREPFGVVCIEAVCSGVPVVCSNAMGLPEAVQHELNGMVVQDRNLQSWINAIQTCCTDNTFREKVFRASLDMREHWAWSNRLKALEKLTFEHKKTASQA
jgi:glycogen(starch) synthase